jgi:hypothetical protein
MKRLLILGLAGIALSACGAREGLRPLEGKALPPAPYGAKATPSASDLLQPRVQTRPARSDDLIESSTKRRSDEFDLPPPN